MRLLAYIFASIIITCCATTENTSTNTGQISDQLYAYEEELKSLVAMEEAREQYRIGQLSKEMCEYRIEMYVYTRKKNRHNGFKIGPKLQQQPTQEEFHGAQGYLLDEIHKLKKSRSEAAK